MRKRRNWGVLFLLSFVISLTSGFVSYAEEISGQQTISQEEAQNGDTEHSAEITAMDEEGNITVVGDTDGIIESSGIAVFSRTAPVQVVNFNTKNGEITEYKEYSTGAAGYTNGDYGADAAYLGTEDGKVKFMLSGVVGLVSESEVQVVNVTEVQSVSYYIVNDGRLWHRIVHNMNHSGYASSLDQGTAPSYLTSGQEYYSYDGHYFYADYATMLDDYVNETRANSVNPSKPYYNYYQYLPLRSAVTYSADTLTSLINSKTVSGSKMRDIGSLFVSNQNTYGVNALIMTGVAANESSWGISPICQSKNNLFGLNAVDESPGTSANAYASINECIKQFAETYMSKRYLKPAYSTYHGAFLGNKASGINVSYASDPYWGEKAANAAWALDKKGGNKDCGKYTIGIKDTIATEHNNVNVRSGSSTSSTALYKTGAWTSYAVLLQKNAAENGFYKIQSDAVLNSGRTAVNSSSGKYDIASMYAYISDDYVTVVNKGNDVTTNPTEDPEEDQKEETTVTYTKYKTTTSVNYRTGAGTSYSKGGTLAAGTVIEVEDGYSKSANGYTWVRFKLNGKNYYIANQYVEKVITLAKPTLVSAKYSSGAVTVTWKKVTDAKGYYVYRKVSGGSWSKIKTITSGSTLTYKDSSSLTEGKTYIYTVKAYAGSTVSGYNSTGVSVTIPKAVTYTKYKTTTSVNYRTGAGTSYSKGGTLASGTTIEVEDGYSKSANGYTWYRFKLNGKNYYIASQYVKKVSTTTTTTTTKTYTKYKTTTKVNYRTGAGTSYSVGGTLASGTTIQVEDGYKKSANGYTWYRFKLNGKNYYIASQYVKKVSTATTTTTKTYTKYKTTTSVNYRTGAGTSYSKGGTLASGKTIEVEDGYKKSANGYTWYRFKLNGKNYYIASQYVKKVSTTTTTTTKTYTKYKTTTSVNYRTGAGTSYSKGGTLASGTTIEVEDGYSKSANGYTWYRFKLNGKNYYIASKYVKKQ